MNGLLNVTPGWRQPQPVYLVPASHSGAGELVLLIPIHPFSELQENLSTIESNITHIIQVYY